MLVPGGLSKRETARNPRSCVDRLGNDLVNQWETWGWVLTLGLISPAQTGKSALVGCCLSALNGSMLLMGAEQQKEFLLPLPLPLSEA